jgi:hypothetical protein
MPFLNEPTPGKIKIEDFEIFLGSEVNSTSAPRYLNALIMDKMFPLP